MDVLHTPLFRYLEDIDKLRLLLRRPSLFSLWRYLKDEEIQSERSRTTHTRHIGGGGVWGLFFTVIRVEGTSRESLTGSTRNVNGAVSPQKSHVTSVLTNFYRVLLFNTFM
jgi:hypothetical protein